MVASTRRTKRSSVKEPAPHDALETTPEVLDGLNAAAKVASKRKATPRPSDRNKTEARIQRDVEKEVNAELEEVASKRRKTTKGADDSTQEKSSLTAAEKTKAGKSAAPANGSSELTRPAFWLMKAEPNSRIENGVDVKFSIDDLKAVTEPEPWEGVRNHVAKKNMMNMQKGELAFFYHSNCKVPGIAGIMEIVRESSVDESAFDPKHPYYDAKSSRDKPRWYHVHVAFKEKFDELITLKEMQSHGGTGNPLQNMQLLKQSRLSVSKVSKEEWDFIMSLVDKKKAG